MQDRLPPGHGPVPQLRLIALFQIPQILAAGWRDFRAAPLYGLFFGAVYVLGGWALWLALSASGRGWWLILLVTGFPLLTPFAAIGLYEVSRRLERGEPLSWAAVLGAVYAQRNRQIPSMAAVLMLFFLVWLFVAHTIFALFFGLSSFDPGGALWSLLVSAEGQWMLAVGGAIGAGFALLLFALSVVSLPLLLDREVDFVTAMITSVSAVIFNPVPMLAWSGIIAVALALAIVPAFLGLLVVLPVLGHASWHLYRLALH